MGFRISFEGQAYELPPGETLVGRDAPCQVQIQDKSVSRRHARIVLVGDMPTLIDLDSRNGTFLDGEPVKEPVPLHAGAEVRVGNRTFRVERSAGPAPVEDTREMEAPSYQVPRLRTCARCRHMIESSARSCPKCGATPRAHKRIPVRLRALYVSGSLTIECTLSDLSEGGAYLRCDLMDEPGTTCDVIILGRKDEVIRLPAQVVRTSERKAEDGMGVSFRALTPAARSWLTTSVGT